MQGAVLEQQPPALPGPGGVGRGPPALGEVAQLRGRNLARSDAERRQFGVHPLEARSRQQDRPEPVALDHGHREPPSVPVGEPVGQNRAQCLAHRRPRHAEPCRQRDLRQSLAGREVTREHQGPQLCDRPLDNA